MSRTLHSPEYEQLLHVLRDARRRAGLRQAEVAQRLGRPQSFVSKVERGERRLDLVELRQLGEALGVTLPTLVRRWERRLSGSA